eukprot:13103769-Heterocapsa_arctica.AAC.1
MRPPAGRLASGVPQGSRRTSRLGRTRCPCPEAKVLEHAQRPKFSNMPRGQSSRRRRSGTRSAAARSSARLC